MADFFNAAFPWISMGIAIACIVSHSKSDHANSNIVQKLWFFAAVCFMIAGMVGKNIVFTILGLAYICIGSSTKNKKTIRKDDEEKQDVK
jgi:hypothetical protein